MSSATLRFYPITISFIQGRRERRAAELLRLARLHVGRRRIKKLIRSLYA